MKKVTNIFALVLTFLVVSFAGTEVMKASSYCAPVAGDLGLGGGVLLGGTVGCTSQNTYAKSSYTGSQYAVGNFHNDLGLGNGVLVGSVNNFASYGTTKNTTYNQNTNNYNGGYTGGGNTTYTENNNSNSGNNNGGYNNNNNNYNQNNNGGTYTEDSGW